MLVRRARAQHRARRDATAPRLADDQTYSGASGVRAAHDPTMLGRSSTHGNGLREILRGGEVQEPVKVDELAAIQPVELGHGLLRVVITKPPEPVGALTQGQLPAGGRFLF